MSVLRRPVAMVVLCSGLGDILTGIPRAWLSEAPRRQSTLGPTVAIERRATQRPRTARADPR
jgi:hypothetical protein